MTAAQEQVLERVKQLLAEHFDASTLVVFADGEGTDQYATRYHGGHATALGLLDIGKTIMHWKMQNS